MSEHKIAIEWKRDSDSFDYKAYSRDHAVIYGNNSRICASSAPEYFGNPECLDPEQAFVTSLASCHMLTFLALASKKQFVVDSYTDNAMGVLGRNEEHKPAIIKIELAPVVTFSGDHMPTEEEFSALHDRAHTACFIANSIHSCVEVVVKPEMKQA